MTVTSDQSTSGRPSSAATAGVDAGDGAGEITRVLAEVAAGETGAEELLMPMVYEELRRIARTRMANESPANTFQPTALVNEAYFRLAGSEGMSFDNRAHFFTAAATAMRRILVESARRRSRVKHGGQQQRSELDVEILRGAASSPEQLLVLDDLISKLQAYGQEVAAVVKLRHFVGMTVREIANVLDSSERSVHRRWNTGKAWLKREVLKGSGSS